MPAAAAAGIDQPWIDLAQLTGAATPPRSVVAAALLSHLLPALAQFDAEGLAPFLPRHARLDALAGRRVRLHGEGASADAVAIGVGSDGGLRVRGNDGAERSVHAGEVSVRALEGANE